MIPASFTHRSSAHWKNPPVVHATDTSTVPPSPHPGTSTRHVPSSAAHTVTGSPPDHSYSAVNVASNALDTRPISVACGSARCGDDPGPLTTLAVPHPDSSVNVATRAAAFICREFRHATT